MSGESAGWSPSDTVLTIREQSTVLADDAVVGLFAPTVFDDVRLSVARSPGDAGWRISAAQHVGMARLVSAGTRHQLRVMPKIEHLDLFFLADWAYGGARDGAYAPPGLRAELAATRHDPAACLLAWYLREASRFATRWLRRGYQSREEVLVGRVRGRLLVDQYARAELPRARSAHVPCRFVEPTHDTPANRYLKAGVRRALNLAGAVPVPAATKALRQQGNRILPLFAAVTDVRATAADADRLHLTGPLRHYRPLVRLTKALMQQSHVSHTAGMHVQDAFFWDMNVLFQEALRGILSTLPGASLNSDRPTARLRDSGGKVRRRTPVDPDYVLHGKFGTLLVDAKYKEALSVAAGDGDVVVPVVPGRAVRVRRADVYQAVAYGRHEVWQPARSCLVYPVALAVGEPYPAPFRVEGFGQPVHVAFADVGPVAPGNISKLHDALLDVAHGRV